MTFEQSPCDTKSKLANFTKYVRRHNLARFMVQYELFKMQLDIKGSIIECGVHHGGGVMAWAKLSAILEPYNYHRKIVGFDTFSGFPSVSTIDTEKTPNVGVGMFSEDYDTFAEITKCIDEFDSSRYLNHISKVELIKGDANSKIAEYISENKHLIVSLLYLDFDIYQPTVNALRNFLTRMPSGAILAFDEVNNSDWPGETMALLEELRLNQYSLKCFPFEPNISYIKI